MSSKDTWVFLVINLSSKGPWNLDGNTLYYGFIVLSTALPLQSNVSMWTKRVKKKSFVYNLHSDGHGDEVYVRVVDFSQSLGQCLVT